MNWACPNCMHFLLLLALQMIMHLLLMIQIHAMVVLRIVCSIRFGTLLTATDLFGLFFLLIWILTVNVVRLYFKILLISMVEALAISRRGWMMRCSTKYAAWVFWDPMAILIIKWIYWSVSGIKIVHVILVKSALLLGATLLAMIVGDTRALSPWEIEHLVAKWRNIFFGMALVKVAKIMSLACLFDVAHSALWSLHIST